MSNVNQEIETFLSSWTTDPNNAKATFAEFYKLLQQEGVIFSFKSRPQISFSLRAKHINQTKREVFVLIDVVDDEPENRWLSVCFYADMVKDPQEIGDFVPQGLLGEDALCFNLESDDPTQKTYISERLQEALTNAAK